MSPASNDQKQRLSTLIDRLFPGCAQKARLMANLADGKGDYDALAGMSDSELAEMATMEKKFLGGRPGGCCEPYCSIRTTLI